MQQFFSVYYPDVCLQLNMFRAFFPDHHQKLNDCSGSLWFYLRIVVIAVLCSWSDRPAPDDGRENARNILSCKQTSG